MNASLDPLSRLEFMRGSSAPGCSAVRRAFTLTELMIVVLIIAIMAAVATPRYLESARRFRVEAAARRIVADLNLVRRNAMVKSGVAQGEWVTFYTATDNYRLINDPDPDHPGEEYWVNFSQTSYPVDLVSVEFTNIYNYTSNSTIKYNMYGVANSGSSPTARLSSGEVVIAAGNVTRTVVIDPVTGKASVQ